MSRIPKAQMIPSKGHQLSGWPLQHVPRHPRHGAQALDAMRRSRRVALVAIVSSKCLPVFGWTTLVLQDRTLCESCSTISSTNVCFHSFHPNMKPLWVNLQHNQRPVTWLLQMQPARGTKASKFEPSHLTHFGSNVW